MKDQVHQQLFRLENNRRLSPLILSCLLFLGCGVGPDGESSAGSSEGLQTSLVTIGSASTKELPEELKIKLAAAESSPEVASIDAQISQLENWSAEQTEGDSENLLVADLPSLRSALATARATTLQAAVFKSLSQEELQKFELDVPEHLNPMKQALESTANQDTQKQALIDRIDTLRKQSESNPQVKTASDYADRLLADFEETDAIRKQNELRVAKRVQAARNTNEMIELMAQAYDEILVERGEEISQESRKRSTILNATIDRYIWQNLTREEKQSLAVHDFEAFKNMISNLQRSPEPIGEVIVFKPTAKLPTTAELRGLIANIITAEQAQNDNMLRRAYNAAIPGGEFDGGGLTADVFAVNALKQELQATVELHGAQLAPLLAELCFDEIIPIASSATSILQSLGEPAREVLSQKQSDAAREELFKLAILKAFGESAGPIDDEVLWKSARDVRFFEIAMRDLAGRRQEIELTDQQSKLIERGLKSSNQRLQFDCLTIAGNAKTLNPDLLDLVEQLAHDSGFVGEAAGRSLSKFGDKSAKVVEELIGQLAKARTNMSFGRDDTAHRRVELANRIGQYRPTPASLASLVVRLQDPFEAHSVREAVARLFREAGTSSIAPISETLKEQTLSLEERLKLIESLGLIKLVTPELTNQLLSTARSSSEREKKAAINSIRNFGPAASAAIPTLLTLVDDDRIATDVMFAIQALLQEPDEAMIRQIFRLVSHRNSYVSNQASEILVKFGPKVDFLLPDVLTLSRSSNSNARLSAASLLGLLGKGRSEAAQRLGQMISESDSYVRKRAIQSVAAIGPDAKLVSTILAKLVTAGNDDAERYEAVWALTQIQDRSPSIISALKNLHQKSGPRAYARYSAVALVALGEPALDYEHDLHYLLENVSSDLDTRFANLAAPQMIAIHPEHTLAQSRIQRLERTVSSR